jgi:hypothetical protein
MAASTLLSNPNRHELASKQLIQSANRNPVESNETKSNNKRKSPMKEKAKNKSLTQVTCS